jgi:hypothetical protein
LLVRRLLSVLVLNVIPFERFFNRAAFLSKEGVFMSKKFFRALLMAGMSTLLLAGTAAAATISVDRVVEYDPQSRDSFPLGQINLVEDASNFDEFNQQHIIIELPRNVLWDQDRVKVFFENSGQSSTISSRDITFPNSQELRIYISQNTAAREILSIQGYIIVQGGRERDDVSATINSSLRNIDDTQLLLAQEHVDQPNLKTIALKATPPITVYPGEYDQALGTITLTESDYGALQVGDTIRLTFPKEVTLGRSGSGGFAIQTKVVSGNVKLGGFATTSGDTASLTVQGASTTPSVVEFSLQRFDAKSTATGEVNVTVEWNKQSTRLLLGKIGNRPVPVRVESRFTIGSDIFYYGTKAVATGTAPYIKDNRTYLPVRFVAMAVGVDEDNIVWNPTSSTVTLKSGGNIMTLVIGVKTATVNGQTVQLEVAPEIVGGRTMLPVYPVAQAFGYQAIWNADEKLVTVR